MKLLFSGHFDTQKSAERIRFLDKMHAHLPRHKLLIFNQSGVCEAPFTVCNVTNGVVDDRYPGFALKKLLNDCISKPSAKYGYCGLNGASLKASRLLWEVKAENQLRFYTSNQPLRVFLRKMEEFIRFLDDEKPNAAFLWNSFNVFHRFAREILRARNIPVYYFHDGVLPGSVAFDFDGEMGESWVARQPEKLLNIEVSSNEIARAQKYVALVQQRNVNRHQQNDHIDFKAHLELMGVDHKPLILMVGQQDWHAGLLPDNPNKRFHSPFFSSSTEALEAVDQVAEEIDAHVLYKPHPLDRDRYAFLKKDRYRNVDIISSGSIEEMIDHAAVTTTIASQACYTAAFRDRPCLLLGRNQMSFKGIADDLRAREDLKDCVINAMKRDNDPTRRKALYRHAAQLNRAYLYDFNTIETDFFVRGPKEAAKDLENQLTAAGVS